MEFLKIINETQDNIVQEILVYQFAKKMIELNDSEIQILLRVDLNHQELLKFDDYEKNLIVHYSH